MKGRLLPQILVVLVFLLAAVNFAAAGSPSAPTPISPVAGANTLSPATISWSAVSDPNGIIGYNWQVSSSSTFGTIAAQNSTNGATQDTASGLANGTYFWHVQAVNGALVKSAWSQAASFNVTGAGPGQPNAPTLAPPKGYSTFHPNETITLNWTAVQGAASYVLQFSMDPSFPQATRAEFNNIPNTAFTFSTPNQGNYYARVIAASSSGITGVPSNVTTFSVSYNNPLPPPPNVVSPDNTTQTLPITFTWTDVPNPQPSGYELQIAKDSGFQTIEDDVPQINHATRTELSLTPGTKFWRVRSAQGDSAPGAAAVTKWSAAGSFTVSQEPPAPVALAFTSNPLYSGNTTWVQIQLSTAAGSSGATINLSSSDANAAPVPATVVMPPNTAWTQFQMKAGQVTSSVPVTITASLNAGSSNSQLNVLPPALNALIITPGMINGGAQPEAIIGLEGVAPAGGASVTLSSDTPEVIVPAVVTVAAGDASVSIPLTTQTVATSKTATITATWNGISVQDTVTLTPQGQPASITLSPTSATGSSGSFARVTVASPATTDQIFQITSSSPAVTVPGSVIIPANSTTGGFNISTTPVSTQTAVTISVSGGGVTKSAVLTLNPTTTPAPAQGATLTVSATGRGGESISSSPAGIRAAVGSSGSASFATGTAITLTVSNGRDAIWSGACSSGGNKTKSCTFTINGNSSVTANVQ